MAKPQNPTLPQRGMRSKAHRRELWFILAMLAIPFVNFLVFWLYPNFSAITMAFQVPSIEGFTLYNFERFFDELFSDIHGPMMWRMVQNSLVMFVVSTFISLPMVLFLSYIIFKKVPGYKVFRVLFYLPAILGATIMAQIFKCLLMTGGPVEQLMDKLHIPIDEAVRMFGFLSSTETGFTMLIVFSLWTGVGVNMIMFTGAMNRVPQEIFESARLDGVGFFKEFFNIILPLIWPTVTTMVVFSMVGIFSNASIVMLLTPENKSTWNIGYYILLYTLNGNNTIRPEDTFGYPAAIGLVFTLVNVPLVFGIKALCDRIGKDVEY